MKKIIIIISLLATIPFVSDAQFKGLAAKIKSKVNNRIDRNVDQQIDKGLDKAEADAKASVKGGQTVTESKTSDTASNAVTETASVKSFSKYDFIPGEEILFYNNFEEESIAELPVGWNTNGTGEVVTLDNFSGKWLRLHNPFVYLTSNTKAFPENYTMEFDIILQLKSNGWMYPEIFFGLLNTKDESTTDNFFLTDQKKYGSVIATLHPGEYKSSRISLNSFTEEKPYFKGDAKPFGDLEKNYGKISHIAIQVQKERFRMWINEEKCFDVPKGIPAGQLMNQLFFKVGQTNYKEDQYGIYVGNIKVATGKADTRHKLVEEGTFSTSGILFDVNAATIKPESAGVLKEVAGVLSQYKDIKVMIIGHTDCDGSDAANVTLSQKRAVAVKDALVNDYSIDASRIETDGKGESAPVADNKTKEGKAANRRVEFIKK